jgi:hypothetical protein
MRAGRPSRASIAPCHQPATSAWLACGRSGCSIRLPLHIRRVAAGERLPILPDRDRQAGSCSPLEGDCRPPRRRTNTGPARVRFFFVLRAGPQMPPARIPIADRVQPVGPRRFACGISFNHGSHARSHQTGSCRSRGNSSPQSSRHLLCRRNSRRNPASGSSAGPQLKSSRIRRPAPPFPPPPRSCRRRC